MSNCLQNFEQIFFKLAEDTEERNLFGIFSSEEKLNQSIDEILKSRDIQAPILPEGELDSKIKDKFDVKLDKYNARRDAIK